MDENFKYVVNRLFLLKQSRSNLFTMEQTHPIFKELINQDVPLANIFLDPNNPRFTSMDWDWVPDEKINSEKIQRELIEKLKEEYSVESLVMNMEINGYLPIDRVVLKKVDENIYVVLEGNRRICAAKLLREKWDENENAVSPEILESINIIPALIYTGSDTEAAWIFQGLRHITGIYEWSAFNKAKLIVTLMEEEGLSLTQVGKRFGLTAFGAGQWVRGYFAFKQAKETSDYVREVDEKAYTYMQELFSRSNAPIREWMDWDEINKKFNDELHFNEFLSWLYPRNTEEFDESIDISTLKGDWKNRKLYKRDDIRTLSYLVSKAPKEFEQFRIDGNLEKSYTIAIQKGYEEEAKKISDPSGELFGALDEVIRKLENIPFKIFRDVNQKNNLFQKLDQITALYKDFREE
ncbi:MAG TPA: hypothetical protein VHA56_16350 [Mucilaginibacter sp.]|nr:hypothetical protein [Mucilaginibacter sp.]